MSGRMWVIAYDVADDRRRHRVEKSLREYAVRVQKSVFEGSLSPADLHELQCRLAACLDESQDSVRFYPLCVWCEDRLTDLGPGGRTDEADYYVF